MNKNELELYIHIPFCVRKCAYCDFLSFVVPERDYRIYMEKLADEIRGQSACFADRRAVSIFLGGGTPSILPADLISGLFDVLRECFVIDADAEITIEANPGTLTMEKLGVYRACGINRISLGLQSADDEELKNLGRIHTYDDFLKSYERTRQAGFSNINVDLMSAIPGQDLRSWRNTLRKVLMLKPEHISAYSLIIEEGTPFFERYGRAAEKEENVSYVGNAGNAEDLENAEITTGAPAAVSTAFPPLPDEDTDREMYHLTKEILAEHGYERYEISNYARPGYECRHNISYWTGVNYLGLGLGASSLIDGYRYHNTSDLAEYLSMDLWKAGAAARDIQKLTVEERMEEFMFLSLRMMEGVSGSEFLARFGRNLWNVYGEVLPKLKAQGLIEENPPILRLTDYGIDVSNVVLSEFLL